jgi:hypothetical protein
MDGSIAKVWTSETQRLYQTANHCRSWLISWFKCKFFTAGRFSWSRPLKGFLRPTSHVSYVFSIHSVRFAVILAGGALIGAKYVDGAKLVKNTRGHDYCRPAARVAIALFTFLWGGVIVYTPPIANGFRVMITNWVHRQLHSKLVFTLLAL